MAAPQYQPAYQQYPAVQQPVMQQNYEGNVEMNSELSKFKDVNQKAFFRDYGLYWLCVIICGAVGFFARQIYEQEPRALVAYLFIFPLIPAGIAYYLRKWLKRDIVMDPTGMNKKKWFWRK